MKGNRMFEGKVAVITGASTGIGLEIAKYLGQAKCTLALIARPTSRLQEARTLLGPSVQATAYPCDLAQREQIQQVATSIEKALGVPDFIIQCAGVWHDEHRVYAGVPFHQTPTEEIARVIDVTLLGHVFLVRNLLPGMVARRKGKILSISGTFESGPSGWLHYFTAKKSLEQFSDGLARELRPHLIQVNTISPSDTATEPYLRFYPGASSDDCLTPQDVAEQAIYLLSPAADHITGACIVVRNKHAKS
jgi:3-oxoacyl-[acyl-carrier protein] reductase